MCSKGFPMASWQWDVRVVSIRDAPEVQFVRKYPTSWDGLIRVQHCTDVGLHYGRGTAMTSETWELRSGAFGALYLFSVSQLDRCSRRREVTLPLGRVGVAIRK